MPPPAIPPTTTAGKKLAAGLFYVLALACFILLGKTELRKWFVMEGQPTPNAVKY